MARLFWKFFWQLSGWKIKGDFSPGLRQCVIAVGPHTSSWDVVIGMAARAVVPIRNAHFLGKKELFKWPLGWFFRWTGGVPVDRSGNLHMVDQVVAMFKQNPYFILALSPEGTRKRVDRLRTGFYYIAKNAGVPLVLAGLDFATKTVIFSPPFMPSGDEAADFRKIIEFFSHVRGKIPELGMQHLASANQTA